MVNVEQTFNKTRYMATVKVKFSASDICDAEGRIFYQIIHNRIVSRQSTTYRIYNNEWNDRTSSVFIPSTADEERKEYLLDIIECIKRDIHIYNNIIAKCEDSRELFTANDVKKMFLSEESNYKFFSFTKSIIDNLKELGKIRCAESYTSTLKSFEKFRRGKEIEINSIDSDIIRKYESFLRNKGVSPNSSSFYMRNLRAIYNRAVEKELTTQRSPFKHVYTGIDKTVKRAVPLRTIREIKKIEFVKNPKFNFARDIFLFSFYTRGMSFVDIAYLKKKDLKNGILAYRRRKTGQQLFIRWEKCMQEIVNKYYRPDSEYLLPIIDPSKESDARSQYICSSHCINRHLKSIGRELGLSIPLTMYVARHAWASIAKSKNIPLSIISEGLGHDSEKTTRIYLTSLDTIAVDKANRLILKSI